MSGFMREAEQEFSGQGNDNQQSSDNYDNQQGGQDQQQQSGGYDQQSGGQDTNQQQGNTNQQSNSSSNQQSSSGGGFFGKAESAGKDVMVDQEVNSFMTKEGIPAGADGFIDNEVNKEVNNFL